MVQVGDGHVLSLSENREIFVTAKALQVNGFVVNKKLAILNLNGPNAERLSIVIEKLTVVIE